MANTNTNSSFFCVKPVSSNGEQSSYFISASQNLAVKQALRLSDEYRLLYDNSPVGSGKTYTAFAIGDSQNLPLYVFCQKGAVEVYEDAHKTMGLNQRMLINTVPYSVVRAKNLKNPVIDAQNELTAFFKQCVIEGVLIVFDEIQLLQGASAQSNVVAEIIQAVLTLVEAHPDSMTRILLISGSLNERANTGLQLLKLLGAAPLRVTKLSDLVHAEVLALTKKHYVDLRRPNGLDMESLQTKSHGDVKAIADKLLSVISIVKERDAKPLNNLHHCSVTLSDKTIQDTCAQLQVVLDSGKKFFNVDACLKNVELEMVPSVAMKIQTVLEADSNAKVVVFCLFRQTLLELGEYLFHRFPGHFLTGDYTATQRQAYLQNFQANTNECRVLLATYAVASTSISLHDLHGDHTRHCFMMEHIHVVEAYQALARVYRNGTKTLPLLYLIYGTSKNAAELVLPTMFEHLKSLQESKVTDDLHLTIVNEPLLDAPLDVTLLKKQPMQATFFLARKLISRTLSQAAVAVPTLVADPVVLTTTRRRRAPVSNAAPLPVSNAAPLPVPKKVSTPKVAIAVEITKAPSKTNKRSNPVVDEQPAAKRVSVLRIKDTTVSDDILELDRALGNNENSSTEKTENATASLQVPQDTEEELLEAFQKPPVPYEDEQDQPDTPSANQIGDDADEE